MRSEYQQQGGERLWGSAPCKLACHRRAAGSDELWARHSLARAGRDLGTTSQRQDYQDLRWLSGGGAVIVRSNRAAARQQQMQELRSKFLAVVLAEGDMHFAGTTELYLARHLHVAGMWYYQLVASRCIRCSGWPCRRSYESACMHADRLDAKLLSLWRSHVSMRAALCELWLDSAELDLAWLRCVILQLTRAGRPSLWRASCFAAVDSPQ